VNGKFVGGSEMVIDLIESDEFINMIPSECIKTNAMERIKISLGKSAVVVFMKGSPKEPADGYQKEVIEMMEKCRVRYTFFDVLKDSVSKFEILLNLIYYRM